ncbi:hypothetical protein ACHAQA_005828 [Verticillium albo-atrum]
MSDSSFLLCLPDELIIIIAKLLVEHLDPQRTDNAAKTRPLLKLCLTSQRLRRVTQPVLYYRILLDDILSAVLLIRSLRECSNLRTLIRRVDIRYTLQYPCDTEELEQFVKTSKAWKRLQLSPMMEATDVKALQVIHYMTTNTNIYKTYAYGLWAGVLQDHSGSHSQHCTCDLCITLDIQKARIESHIFNERFQGLNTAYAILLCMLPRARHVCFAATEREEPAQTIYESFLDRILSGLLEYKETYQALLPSLETMDFICGLEDAGYNESGTTVFLPSLLRLPTLKHVSGSIKSLDYLIRVFPFESLNMNMMVPLWLESTQLFGAFPKLKKLTISSCRPWSHRPWTANSVPDVVRPSLSIVLPITCPLLEHLVLTDNPIDQGLRDIRDCLAVPLRLSRLQTLKISTWWPESILAADQSRRTLNIGHTLPVSLEYFSFRDARTPDDRSRQAEGASASSQSDIPDEPWRLDAAASWATVASAHRQGLLPNLKRGFFIDEEFGILPLQAAEAEKRGESQEDG